MKTIEELERDADHRKTQFEARIEQIRQRLMPQNIADEALGALALPGIKSSDAMIDTARRNPFVILGLAAGAGWLFLNARQRALRSRKRTRRNHKRVKEIEHVSPRR
jgi:hypothetical protein